MEPALVVRTLLELGRPVEACRIRMEAGLHCQRGLFPVVGKEDEDNTIIGIRY